MFASISFSVWLVVLGMCLNTSKGQTPYGQNIYGDQASPYHRQAPPYRVQAATLSYGDSSTANVDESSVLAAAIPPKLLRSLSFDSKPIMQDAPVLRRPNMEGPILRPNMEGPILRPNMEGPILRPNMEGPILRPNMEGPILRPNMEGPILGPNNMEGPDLARPMMDIMESSDMNAAGSMKLTMENMRRETFIEGPQSIPSLTVENMKSTTLRGAPKLISSRDAE